VNVQKDDIFTGLFVLIGTLLGLGLLITLLGFNVMANRTEYVLRLDQLAGLKKGTSILWKNYKVGEVVEVIPVIGSNIFFKANLYIDSNLKLYRDTKIIISKKNVIGDTVIRLSPGKKKEIILKEDDTLFATNISNLDALVDKISAMTNSLTGLVGTLDDIVGSSKNSLLGILGNFNQTSRKINTLTDASAIEVLASLKNIKSTTATLDKFMKKASKDPLGVLKKKEAGSKKEKSNGYRPPSDTTLP